VAVINFFKGKIFIYRKKLIKEKNNDSKNNWRGIGWVGSRFAACKKQYKC
jgi:hypothetical protein